MAVLASDNFNRANEVPIASPWGSPNVTGDLAFQLTGNTCNVNSGSLGSDNREWYDGGISWPNDQYVLAQLTVSGTAGSGSGIGLIARSTISGTKTFYRLCGDHAASNNVKLKKSVAGTSTTIQLFTQAWNDGDTWKLECIGTTLNVYLNGSLINTNTDSAITSGNPGVAYSATETSASVDNWEAGSIGSTAVGGIVDIAADIMGGLAKPVATGWI